jgi:alkylation response protein AidB-like acyl-CoA dehydrogenase
MKIKKVETSNWREEMNFELTMEQQKLQQEVLEFCQRECPAEFESKLDETGEYPAGLYEKMVGSRFFSLPYPKEFGGYDGNIFDAVLTTEVLSQFSGTAVYMYLVNVVFTGMIILNSGNDEQKSHFIPRILRGEDKFSFALTEPDAGSDARSIKTTAVQEGDKFVISGTKYWTTGATIADYIVTIALTTQQDASKPAMTVFIVPTNAKGMKITPIPKLAGEAFPSCEVVYDNVTVPASNILGGIDGLNNGIYQLVQTADLERVCVAASCVGMAETILRECTDYAKTREQFNSPIIKFQAIQHSLADSATEIEAMRWMTYHAAWMRAEGKSCFKEISMAKLFCSETLNTIVKRGMKILGGRGYSMEYRMQRYLRESYLSLYAGGTSEIQKNVISRFL